MASHSDRIIHHMEIRRIFRQMVDVLEPHDMPILALRLEGLREADVARLLGMSRTTLNILDRDLKARIQAHVPEAWDLIHDLRRRSGHRVVTDPLDRGWISEIGAVSDELDGHPEPQTPDPTPPLPEKIARSTEDRPGPDTSATKNRNQRS